MLRTLIVVLSLLLTFQTVHAVQCGDLVPSRERVQAPDYEYTQVNGAERMRLDNKEGVRNEIDAPSAYFQFGRIKHYVRDLVQTIINRGPQRQAKINEIMTEEHGLNGMTFRQKNEKTQKYDKEVAVEVQGTFLPFRKDVFQSTVESTGPVLRKLREVLQEFYSNPTATARELGIEKLSREEQEMFMQTLQESIYTLTVLRSPSMKDYPFLTVAGVDAVVGRINSRLSQFFEFNLGTPSGLSNLIQLVETMRLKDPAQYKEIKDFLRDDKTFEILRETIEEAAFAWTGKKGISVVIGPGAGNGAHPDVVAIANFSGMPLVNGRDLYIDARGDVRLNTGKRDQDPHVTGIYARAEESFVLQNSKDQVGMIAPHYEAVNARLSAELGIPLKSGVIYKYKYNAQGKEIGLIKENGKPVIEQYMDSIGKDPARPNVEAGSLARAVVNKKLFVSNVGGRTVDDKGLFEMASKLARMELDAQGKTETPVAGPPPTLSAKDYHLFYKNPERYVMKVRDESGGVGVYINVNLTKAERANVVEMHKRDPDKYIVQEFSAGQLHTGIEFVGGKPQFGSVVVDARIFVFMDSKGNVRAGDNSMLIRTAQAGSASTNTSQRGGYTVGGVLHAAKKLRDIGRSYLPHIRKNIEISLSKKLQVRDFVQQFQELRMMARPESMPNLRDLEISAYNLAMAHREVSDVLGIKYNRLMT